jgi:threonine/homoserine efflux transporter RhtA
LAFCGLGTARGDGTVYAFDADMRFMRGTLAAAMLAAFVFVSPIGFSGAAHALGDPIAIAAGIGVGVSSSVIPYVFDQLAMARLPRATYALFVALLPATATAIGVVVLSQLPSAVELGGIALVMAGVALHRPDAGDRSGPPDTLNRWPATPPSIRS